jgi:structural maintenance of chromosome 2
LFLRANFVAQTEYGEVEGWLQEERAMLTWFDMELCDLDEVIKVKKQAAADVDVSIKKVEYEVQALAKEKASHLMGATNLKKQYNWIAEESQ